MPNLALALLTALLGALKFRRDLVLENLALRHQLAVLAALTILLLAGFR